jgi:opacity protein-like surface antigen
MRNLLITLSFIFLLSFITTQISYSQLDEEKDSKYYIGIGTSLSTFVGGDFGKIFAIRYTTDSDNNDNGYYYNKSSEYYDNSSNSLNPLQFDLVAGVNITRDFAFELETSFIWHSNGKVNPDYSFGSEGDFNYIDRYDNSTLFALPVMASLKVYPLGRDNVSFYLKGGYGIQYTQESLEKIREFYTTYNYGYYFRTETYEFPIAEYSANRLLHGFKAAAGFSYNLFGTLAGDIELRYTNFFINENKAGPLSMSTTPVIGNIALGTIVYLNY